MFKRFILKEKLEKVWKIDFTPIFRTKHGSMPRQLRENSELVRNIQPIIISFLLFKFVKENLKKNVLNFYNRQV